MPPFLLLELDIASNLFNQSYPKKYKRFGFRLQLNPFPFLRKCVFAGLQAYLIKWKIKKGYKWKISCVSSRLYLYYLWDFSRSPKLPFVEYNHAINAFNRQTPIDSCLNPSLCIFTFNHVADCGSRRIS